jgi:hypothetical protein
VKPCKSLRKPALIEAMTTDTADPLFERFRLTYPSGTAVEAFYCGGATLREVRVVHPMAVVEAVEDSRVSVEADRP